MASHAAGGLDLGPVGAPAGATSQPVPGTPSGRYASPRSNIQVHRTVPASGPPEAPRVGPSPGCGDQVSMANRSLLSGSRAGHTQPARACPSLPPNRPTRGRVVPPRPGCPDRRSHDAPAKSRCSRGRAPGARAPHGEARARAGGPAPRARPKPCGDQRAWRGPRCADAGGSGAEAQAVPQGLERAPQPLAHPTPRGGLARQAGTRLGCAGAWASGSLRGRARLATGSGGAGPQPGGQDDKPHHGTAPARVDKEGWYQSQAPAEEGARRAWYWSLGLLE
jgi:hypothetical protein